MSLLIGQLPHVLLGCLSAEGQTATQVLGRVAAKSPNTNEVKVRQMLKHLRAKGYARTEIVPGRQARLYSLTPAGERALDTARYSQPRRVLRVLGTIAPLTTRDLARALGVNPGTLSSVLTLLRREGQVRKVPASAQKRYLSGRSSLIAWTLTEAA